MPKRTCPFEEDCHLLPQMKMHVGEKQVDNGVSSDQRMRDVYSRTLNLLKAGAKTLSHKLNTSGPMDSLDLPSPQCPSPCKFKSISNMKQMLLTDKLQLKTSDKVVNVGCGIILALGPSYMACDCLFFFQDIRVDLCGCYRLIDRSIVSACYYCDQALCSSCQSVCANCSELFCQNCSLPVYNCDEQIMCLNCYR
ncbi:SIVA protein, partial [Acromyrmex heyeri]